MSLHRLAPRLLRGLRTHRLPKAERETQPLSSSILSREEWKLPAQRQTRLRKWPTHRPSCNHRRGCDSFLRSAAGWADWLAGFTPPCGTA